MSYSQLTFIFFRGVESTNQLGMVTIPPIYIMLYLFMVIWRMVYDCFGPHYEIFQFDDGNRLDDQVSLSDDSLCPLPKDVLQFHERVPDTQDLTQECYLLSLGWFMMMLPLDKYTILHFGDSTPRCHWKIVVVCPLRTSRFEASPSGKAGASSRKSGIPYTHAHPKSQFCA